MHFHSLNGPFCAVTPGIILIHITRHLSLWATRRLFAIIKGLEHPRIRTGFRKQKVILEYTILRILCLSTVAKFGRSIILKVLHEARLGLIHNISVMRRALLRWIVEAGGRGIGTRTEA